MARKDPTKLRYPRKVHPTYSITETKERERQKQREKRARRKSERARELATSKRSKSPSSPHKFLKYELASSIFAFTEYDSTNMQMTLKDSHQIQKRSELPQMYKAWMDRNA